MSWIKIVLDKTFVLIKNIVSTGQFFVFMDIWAFPGDFLFLVLSCRRHSIYGAKTSLRTINIGGRNAVENGRKTFENRRK